MAELFNLPNGHHPDIKAQYYHGDILTDVPTLNRGALLDVVTESPLHAWHRHPRFGAAGGIKPNKKMDFGSVCHELVLGAGGGIVLIVADDYKTKAAQALRDQANAEGKTPCLEKDHDRAQLCVAAFWLELDRMGLSADFKAGQSEVTALWDEEVNTAAGQVKVRCRCRFDRVFNYEPKITVFDLKIGSQSNPAGLGRHIYNENLHVQRDFYMRGAESLNRPVLGGRGRFIFLFMSDKPPFQLVPAELNGEFKMLGVSVVERGLGSWGRCLQTGQWPGYPAIIQQVEPPKFAMNEEIKSSTISP